MANRDLQEETDAFVDFLNEWGAKHLGPCESAPIQVSGGSAQDDAATRQRVDSGAKTCLTGSLPSPGIHLVDREISQRCPNCVNGGVWVGGQERYIPCNCCGGTGEIREQVQDREISLGTHPQGCNCLECAISQKFEEEL